MRCFIAIDLPEEIKDELKRIQDSLPQFKGKMTERENLHLTLKFLGELDNNEIEIVKDSLKKLKFISFGASIGRIGMFSERIIWIELKNCSELQKKIDMSIKSLFEKEERFMGHITIARPKSIKDKKSFSENIEKIKIKDLKFEVRSFSLKKSTLSSKGPIYEDLETFYLD